MCDLKKSLRNVSGNILSLIYTSDSKNLNTNLAKDKIRKQKAILDRPRMELGNSIGNLSRLKSDFIGKRK